MEPDERPTIHEILESAWLSDAYDQEMAQYVHKEMEQRKIYILQKNRDKISA